MVDHNLIWNHQSSMIWNVYLSMQNVKNYFNKWHIALDCTSCKPFCCEQKWNDNQLSFIQKSHVDFHLDILIINHYVSTRTHLFWVVTALIFFHSTCLAICILEQLRQLLFEVMPLPDSQYGFQAKKKTTEKLGAFVNIRKQFLSIF